jgi:cellulose biosynthesis protein BcsQ
LSASSTPSPRVECPCGSRSTRSVFFPALARALQPVSTTYDYIILDCPPSLGALTETGIAAADLIIIPCQMEARAADGLVDILELIGIIKGEAFDQWRILLTKMDNNARSSSQLPVC